MHEPRVSLTAAIGERLRRSRHGVGRSRQSIGDAIGASEWTIGRMERGEGDGIAVRRWGALADALGWRLTVGLEAQERREADEPPGPRVLTAGTVERLARRGGWTLTASDDHVAILDRAARAERFVVYLCDRPIEILDAVDDQQAARAGPTRVLPSPWREASLTIVRAELRDRYRPMDWLADDLALFVTSGSQAIAAFRNERVPMPDRDVLVWCDGRATRLIPFGLNLEPRRRAYRRRPERRRRAVPCRGMTRCVRVA